MFEQNGAIRSTYTTTVDNKETTIEVKYSIVKPEALKQRGSHRIQATFLTASTPRHNIGVSVVREDREIVLEDAFLREGGSSENPAESLVGL